MKSPVPNLATYDFFGQGFARPLRAMAQWVERHPEVIPVSVAIENSGSAIKTVTLTVELLDD